MQRKHIIGYAATAVIALGIGGAGHSGSGSAPSAQASSVTPSPAVTTTVTVPVPGPEKTVVSPKPAKTVVVKVTPAPKVAFPGDGTFEVGVDIKPGTYASTTPDSGNCYWARLRKNGDIIDNNNSAGPSVVTIAPGDSTFQVDGCSDWTRRH